MQFRITGFSIEAENKVSNEDRVLIQDCVFCEGLVDPYEGQWCRGFVADGIGGASGGAVASEFVLKAIAERLSSGACPEDSDLLRVLRSINEDLITFNTTNPDARSAGTTLVGALLWPGGFRVVNAGDSQAWLLRDKRFFRITEDQVVNPSEPGSALVSYFGGRRDELDLSIGTFVRELIPGDMIVICSDGLFKALKSDHVRLILSNNQSLSEKARFLYENVRRSTRPDDTSCIVIEVNLELEKGI